MSNKNDGGPAFPVNLEPHECITVDSKPLHGMTLRDWFAGQALPALIAKNSDDRWTAEEVAQAFHHYAGAMLAAREAGK